MVNFPVAYFKDYSFFNKSKVNFYANVAASAEAYSSAFKAYSYSSRDFSFFSNLVTSPPFAFIAYSSVSKAKDFSFSSFKSPSNNVMVSLRILMFYSN